MKNKILVLLLTFLMAAPLFAQLDRSVRPKPGPAPEIKIGDYEEFQLENGLKVFVVENHKLPRIVFRLVFDYDPVFEGEQAGYVQAAGDLLRRGTKTRTKAQIDEEVDFIGATLNTSAGGFTGVCLSKYSDKIMELMSDLILNSEFKQEELDKIKTQMISGLTAAKDDPGAIANRVRNKVIYGAKHPYGELQSENTVEVVTLEKCNEFYKSHIVPNISYLAIVGDINKERAEELVKKYLSDWKKVEVKSKKYKRPKAPLVRKVSLVDRSASVQSVVRVAYPVKIKKSSKDVIAAKVLNQILGGSATARLFMNLREDKGFTYGCYSSLNEDEVIGNFNAGCEVRNSATDSAVTEILFEMKKMRDEKVTDEELQGVKNFMTGSFARSMEQPETIANFALNIARYGLAKDYYKNYLKILNNLTVDDIQTAAKKYLKPNKAHIVICGNGDEIAENLKSLSPSGKVNWLDADGNIFDPAAKALPEGLTYQQVLEKNIEAIGGRENVLNVKDRKLVVKGTIQEGMEIVVTTFNKAPNKLRVDTEVAGMKMYNIFDGEKGKTSRMGQEKMLEGDELEMTKQQANIYVDLDYENNGKEYKLVGMESLDGKDAFKISVKATEKSKSLSYFDIETGLILKTINTMDTPNGPVTTTIQFEDYREIEGVKYAYKMNTFISAMNMSVEMIVQSLEINKGLADSLFTIE